MPVAYVLDDREKGLIAIFTSRKVPHRVKRLDLGDALILHSAGEIPEDPTEELSAAAKKLLGGSKDESSTSSSSTDAQVNTITVERKSFTDLDASMSDGRYHEQKSRYMKLPRGSMFYILENNDPGFAKLGRDQYLGMYTHTVVRDGIPVFLTSSMQDTADTLISIGKTLERFGFQAWLGGGCPVEATQIRKKKLAGKDVFKAQLCCFSGISSAKADLIRAEYPDMLSLMSALEDGTFKVKGVGKVLIAAMRDGLFHTRQAPSGKAGSSISFE